MAEGTAFRLDTVDIAVESGWQFEHTSRIDEFSKDGVTVTVQYSADDDITSLTRSGKRSEDEVFGFDSAGKPERLRIWLTRRGLNVTDPAVQGGNIPKHLTQKPGDWTRLEFLEAVGDPGDRAFLQRLLELIDANSQLSPKGPHSHLYFGKRPGGAMFVYPFGRRHPPFKFSIKSGQLMISGCWTGFPGVKAHSGFAALAAMLDLDESGPATAVPVAGLDADEVWQVGETVSQAINS
ncbi:MULTISPECIES: hypothetical protein [Mycolicibacterium]|uniref:hypothetical protein n=1 Tax=Mycolicibacterium TaxID=1866885 RepID=UPI0023BA7B22|nr:MULTISPECIES: hypothetical protein [Mycolicibacterium]MDW5611469.1 hypothetical protein [Mycolicibacterium sp. D5.8-2]